MPDADHELASVLLWGGASQARIIHQMLLDQGRARASLIFDPLLHEPAFATDAAFIRDPAALKQALAGVSCFVVCVGNEHGYARFQISRCLQSLGLKPLSLRHPSSILDSGSSIGPGCQMMPLSVLHKFSHLGSQCILNTSASVDHECVVGDGVHIMGAAAVAGRVSIGDFATIGTNATILPGLSIGEGAYVGAGSVVTRDVAPHAVVAGNPAKFLRSNSYRLEAAPLQALGWKEAAP